ncbi:MAG: hypothetical protein AAF088_07845 [Pseudomonadota bacterium]
MTFFRPEAIDAIRRWYEVLAGLAFAALSVWLFTRGGLLSWVSVPMIAGAVALIWVGVQRGRFRQAGDGAGAVQVDEGRVIYFGPLSGGSVALADLDRLILDGTQHPPHWHLHQPGNPPLLIPVNAVGADDLFDAFATLPGLRTGRMLTELEHNPDQAVVIWERTATRPPEAQLH